MKQESKTMLTIFAASTSSLHFGLFCTDNVALLRTHAWCCRVKSQIPLVKASLAHLHSPLNDDALIYSPRPQSAFLIHPPLFLPPSANRKSAYLRTSMMFQIIPIHLKFQLVIRMYKLMCKGVFGVTSIA